MKLATVIALLSLLSCADRAAERQPTNARSEAVSAVDSLRARGRAVAARLDGELVVKGLTEPVEVLRDRWGVPHIYARNQQDLFFAQGFVGAQDRLFQIDLWRRIGVGELSEALGRSGLRSDRIARLTRYRGDPDAEWNSYSPDSKEIATAFAAGINAYIEQTGNKLAIEFEVLGYRPATWRAEDCLVRMPALELVDNFTDELLRARLIAALGLERARELAPTDPQVPFALHSALNAAEFTPAIVADFDAATAGPRFDPDKKGSNNWVVAGHRSKSGSPLLASDPHRALKNPSLRYLVHLNAPGWNVVGSGEPALPGVALGHNDTVAWGFTIVGTDQADLYVEETHADDPTVYRVGKQWERMSVTRESVKVKGEPAVELELRHTRHGAVLYQDEPGGRAYALRWVGSEPGTAAYLGGLALARAKTAGEFLKAAAAWKTPGENLVFADTSGQIGWIAAGLTPIRRGWHGVLPVPGADGEFEWQGFLHTHVLPQDMSPADGFVVTANQNILPPGYPHQVAYDWYGSSYRFTRLRDRLTGGLLDIAAMRGMQQDVTALDARALQRILGKVATDTSAATQRSLFLQWDGVMSIDSQAATLHAVWLEHLKREFYGSRVPASLVSFLTRAPGIERMLVAIERADRAWFGANPVAARDRLIRETFGAAAAELETMCSLAAKTCAWGKLHTTTFAHSLASVGKDYESAWSLEPVPTPGGFLTPNQNRYKAPFRNVHGASYRQIFDLADWDKGVATSVPGQSGQPGSAHYDDLLPLWAKGEYFPLAFTRKRVEEVTAHRLLLRPEPE